MEEKPKDVRTAEQWGQAFSQSAGRRAPESRCSTGANSVAICNQRFAVPHSRPEPQSERAGGLPPALPSLVCGRARAADSEVPDVAGQATKAPLRRLDGEARSKLRGSRRGEVWLDCCLVGGYRSNALRVQQRTLSRGCSSTGSDHGCGHSHRSPGSRRAKGRHRGAAVCGRAPSKQRILVTRQRHP